jgi:branched-chain amino acid transport system ATP-binding protein
MTTALLTAASVSKHYGEFRALQDVSFNVDEDEFLAIVGPNGAGKTTLVNVLTGLLKPTTGSVTFKGRDIAGVGPVELSRRGMARAFQLVQVFPTLTVFETLAVAAAARQGKGTSVFASMAADASVAEECRYVASLFKLSHRLATPASALAQGEKKLLDVASAFALKPEVILLDEPTSGVSTVDKHTVMDVLLKAAQLAGVRSILLIEHDMELVHRYARRVIALQGGRLVADRPTDAFFADDELVATVAGKPPAPLHLEMHHAHP